MMRKVVLAMLILLAALIPVGIVMADYTAEDCADGEWEVRPGQTVYQIAYICSVQADALIAYNNLANPNLINTGQILLIPPADFQSGDSAPAPAADDAPPASEPAATPVPTAAPAATNNTGSVTVDIGNPIYSGDGRVASVNISVTNNSVEPAVAGGRYYATPPGDNDAPYWVTLIGAVHADNPYPEVHTEPLWHATVYLDNGVVFPAYAGCLYSETIFAMGDEPLSRAENIWFHWETTLDGGWFDCGNAYQVKPEDLKPGESGSAPLTLYLVHPRKYNDIPFVETKVTRIDVEIFDANGNSLGTVASRTY